MAKGQSFAADMKAKLIGPPVPPKPRSPNVEYDAAGNVRNPLVRPGSPQATMKKGRPVAGPTRTPAGQVIEAGAQTLADTYHLGDKPLPWQTAMTPKKKNGNGGK